MHEDASTGDRAPGRLALVQALANSYDELRGRDDLAHARAASAWLTERGLIAPDMLLSDTELAALQRLRAAVRGLALANSGCEPDPENLRLLNRVALAAGVHPTFVGHAEPRLAVNASGGLGATGRLAAIVFEAAWDGTWSRLKACPGDACNYAFYDRSRNNSRQWCSMARCGSRAKMRAYRARCARRDTL